MLPVSCCAEAKGARASAAARAAVHAHVRPGLRGRCAFIVRILLTLATRRRTCTESNANATPAFSASASSKDQTRARKDDARTREDRERGYGGLDRVASGNVDAAAARWIGMTNTQPGTDRGARRTGAILEGILGSSRGPRERGLRRIGRRQGVAPPTSSRSG